MAAVATAQARATASMVTLLPAAGSRFLWLIDRPALAALLRLADRLGDAALLGPARVARLAAIGGRLGAA